MPPNSSPCRIVTFPGLSDTSHGLDDCLINNVNNLSHGAWIYNICHEIVIRI